MNKVYFLLVTNEDGSLTIPAFAARGLGLFPGDAVTVECPAGPAACDAECDESNLFLGRCCSAAECGGYTCDGSELNVPAKMLADAGIACGADLSVFAGDKALVMVAGADELEDLAVEIGELLAELGIQAGPLRVVPLEGRR